MLDQDAGRIQQLLNDGGRHLFLPSTFMLFNVLKCFVQLVEFFPHLLLFLFVVDSFFRQFGQSFFITDVFTFSVFLGLLLLDLLLLLVIELVELEHRFLFEFRLFFTFSLEVFSLFCQLLLFNHHFVFKCLKQNVEVALHIDTPLL